MSTKIWFGICSISIQNWKMQKYLGVESQLTIQLNQKIGRYAMIVVRCRVYQGLVSNKSQFKTLYNVMVCNVMVLYIFLITKMLSTENDRIQNLIVLKALLQKDPLKAL